MTDYSIQCPVCKNEFPYGIEFNDHVLACADKHDQNAEHEAIYAKTMRKRVKSDD